MYELTRQYRALLEFDTDPTAEDTEAWNALMGDLQDDIQEKAINIARVLRTLEYEAQILRDEEKRLAEARHIKEAKYDRLKTYLRDAMIATNTQKAEIVGLSVSLRKTPLALVAVDEQQVPEEFWIPQLPKLDRRGLLEHVKAHPDCGFAVAASGQTVSIK